MRTVVVQVEKCEVAVLVGFRPASGEATDRILAQIGSQPTSRMVGAAKSVLAQQALAALTIAHRATSASSKPLVPTRVRAKIGVDPGGTRPMVAVLVTYALPHAGTLVVTSNEPRSTRISWADRASTRVDLEQAPAQGRWFTGVASFLLSLVPSRGDLACATTSSSH